MPQIAHLHLHTQYSLLDGANRIKDILKLAHKMGQPAIAMTDHGNMHGAIEFYSEAKKVGIKPLIGCELYVNPNSRHERIPNNQGGGGAKHLTVLAKDLAGYRNLCRLVTLAYREGFYFKPRVDHELLQRYSEGLIALSGCLSSEISHYVTQGDGKGARSLVEFYASTFRDNYYLEVQPHAIADQQRHNQACAELAKELGLPMVITNDCHYPGEDDHYAQEVLMCISTGKSVHDPKRMRHEGVHLHLKSGDEVLQEMQAHSYAEEALRNTLAIAEACNVEFDFKTYYMPRFETGDELTPIQLMQRDARAGLERRFAVLRSRTADWSAALEQEYRDRLEEEIELIDSMGFAGYFLVVADFIVWAKERGIPVGPGRGSAAGSLVAYAMRITDIDPIQNKLIFERFLNPERVSLPDIDVDFCIYGRDAVIQYVVEKYGTENVAQIATFGTLKAKAVIKDVGRALGLSYAETDRVAQLVPAPRQGFDFSISEALDMEPKLAEYAKSEGKELIRLAMKLEGLTRHSSTHAAGVVIGDRPLIEHLPLFVDKDGNEVTQFSMKYVEKIGLVKFDFLGLKTLTVIDTAVKLIEQSQGRKLDPALLPIDDSKTYDLLCSGDTTGIFQLESGGITEMAIRLRPTCFDDLTAILALYRPGPLDSGMADHYIERKHGREPVSYLHPKMKDILSDTYGIIVYQEQIMQLARELAGYSLGEADLLRRAMGKKIPEEMAAQSTRFVGGATERGIERAEATEIFKQMETFARYGFNRSHSAAYALISFQTAYFKAHYPVEFMAALMSHEMGDSDKTLKNLNECRRHKIKVLPPDVNQSTAGFSVQQGLIRFGLEAVKGLGAKVVEGVLEVRNADGPFEDMEDFLMRAPTHVLNRRVLEGLVKSGAFDFSKVSRRELAERLEELLQAAHSVHKHRSTNQMTLFSGTGDLTTIARRRLDTPEWPINQRLAFEREALGLYISGHPLQKFIKDMRRLGTRSIESAKELSKTTQVRVGGVVTALKLKNTKRGDRYATFTFEDWSGTIEAIVWPDRYVELAQLLASDDPVVVSGNLDVSEERRTLIVNALESLIELRDRNASVGWLELQSRDTRTESLQRLRDLFGRHGGNCPVRVRFETKQANLVLHLRDQSDVPVQVMPSETLCDEVEQLFGRPVLFFR